MSNLFAPSHETIYFEFLLLIDPVAKGRPRYGQYGNIYTPDKTRIFEENLKALLAKHWQRPPLNEAIYLEVVFNFEKPKSAKRLLPSVRPDGDNLMKAFKDAGNGILWTDDCLITTARYSKRYSDRGSIEVRFCLDSI